jgi:hypothetical protein
MAKPVFVLNAGITWLLQKQKKNDSYSSVYNVYTWRNYIGELRRTENGLGNLQSTSVLNTGSLINWKQLLVQDVKKNEN